MQGGAEVIEPRSSSSQSLRRYLLTGFLVVTACVGLRCTLWLASREDEAFAIGEAELRRIFGSDAKKARWSNTRMLLDAMRLATEASRDSNSAVQALLGGSNPAAPKS